MNALAKQQEKEVDIMRTMRTEAEIQAEIDALTREFEAVREEAKARAEMSEDHRLATELHSRLCHWNHTDQCGWDYEKEWTGYAHKRYLAKAQKALEVADFDTIVAVIKAVK